MAADLDYVRKARRLGLKGLRALWRQILAGETPGWDKGKAFEYLVLRAFELEGTAVRWPFQVELAGTVIEQIDGVVYLDWLTFLVEAKDQEGRIAIEPIAKLRNQLSRRPPGTLGLVFSKTDFTDPAYALTTYISPLNILLWKGVEVEYALRNQKMCEGLRAKFRHAVEQGWPDFDVRVLR